LKSTIQSLENILRNSIFISFYKSFSWLTFQEVLVKIITFFIQVKIINYLGPSQYGMLAFSIMIIEAIKKIFDFGTSTTTINNLNDGSDKNVVISAFYGFKLFSIISVLAIIQILYFTNIFDSKIALYSLVLIPFIFKHKEVVFMGENLFSTISISKIISRVIFFILTFVAIVKEFSIHYIIIAYILESSIYFFLLNIKAPKFKLKLNFELSKKLFLGSYHLGLASLAVILSTKIDQFYINYLLSPKDLGIYTSAVKISEIVLFPAVILNTSIYHPLLLISKKSKSKFKKTVYSLLTIFGIYTLIICVVINLNSDYIIDTLFVSEYSESKYILSLYVFSLSPYLIFFLLINVLKIKNENQSLFKSSLISLALNIITTPFLISYFDLKGAVYASIICNLGFYLIIIKNVISKRIL
jgi:polysaccharide transporter, PST family